MQLCGHVRRNLKVLGDPAMPGLGRGGPMRRSLRLLPLEEPPARPPRTLYPGDVIEYYTQMFGVGDPRGLRQATIVCIDREPDERYPVSVNTIEVLSLSTYVRPLRDREGLVVTAGMLPLKEFDLVYGTFDAPMREQALNAGLREAVSAAYTAIQQKIADGTLTEEDASRPGSDGESEGEQQVEWPSSPHASAGKLVAGACPRQDYTHASFEVSPTPPAADQSREDGTVVDGSKLDDFEALPTAAVRRVKHRRGKDRLGVRRRSRKKGHQRLSAVVRDSVGVYHARSEDAVALKKYVQLQNVKEAIKERKKRQSTEEGAPPDFSRVVELDPRGQIISGNAPEDESEAGDTLEPVLDVHTCDDGKPVESPQYIDITGLDEGTDDGAREEVEWPAGPACS